MTRLNDHSVEKDGIALASNESSVNHPREIGTKIVLLRHGKTDWNVSGRFQGFSDVPLNSLGRVQAEQVAPALAEYDFDVIYASTLSRAVETARPVAELLGLPIRTDERLKEINTGEWEGLTITEVDKLDPEFRPALRAGRDHRRSPTGETAEETGVRAAEGLRDIAAKNEGRTILVVSHGLAIRSGLAHILGWGMDGFWNIGDLHNCHWASIGWQWNTWRLLEYGFSVPDLVTAEEPIWV